ncbi:nuclease-related domain-containing protein [Metasolibacillus sp.]|uniref:nuclease-related domain-containing protein n=1 Tax=Metasolibacillus sp. TaxID=2703680 RepID=UPI0025F35799|nr:nuclease-related domain-containing protein [Metasolibacillus sp.]MCT6922944.1 NERD domain-containing protein [Metasolibacillus sp.]MCT6939182.1 NERD domain-containing protein [Metasolibacillus sp.]
MRLQQLEAIIRRIDAFHPDYLYFKEQLAMANVGVSGEDEVQFFLQELATPHRVIRNFSFFNAQQQRHEIDFIVIFPSLIVCLEVKNIAGTLHFDAESSQLLRTRADGVTERFANPIEQLNRHLRALSSFFPHIPLHGAVVIANRRAIIASKPPDFPIFHADYVLSFIEKKLVQHCKPILDLDKVYAQLLSLHSPKKEAFTFTLEQLKCGVFCEKCAAKMRFAHGKFLCPHCRFQNKYAHFQALHDFRLLVDTKITNQQFCVLCDISSRHAAKRLLRFLPLSYKKGHSYYEIPEQIFTMIPDKSSDSLIE